MTSSARRQAIARPLATPRSGVHGLIDTSAYGGEVTDLGMHSHSFDQKVVAVSGTFEFQLEGGPMQELPPGSYIFTPAHVKHSAKCKDGAECIYFEEQPGKADFIPAK